MVRPTPRRSCKRHPLHEATDADLVAQTQLALQIRDKVTEANSAVIQIRDLKKQITDRLTKSQDGDLKISGDKLTAGLTGVEEDVYQVRNAAGEDPLNFPIKTNNSIASLLRVVTSGRRKTNRERADPIFTDLKAGAEGREWIIFRRFSTSTFQHSMHCSRSSDSSRSSRGNR